MPAAQEPSAHRSLEAREVRGLRAAAIVRFCLIAPVTVGVLLVSSSSFEMAITLALFVVFLMPSGLTLLRLSRGQAVRGPERDGSISRRRHPPCIGAGNVFGCGACSPTAVGSAGSSPENAPCAAPEGAGSVRYCHHALGWAAVAGDAGLLCCMPVVWHLAYTSPENPLLHLLRHQLTPATLLLIVASGLALRPAFPLFLTLVGVLLQSVLIVLALTDWRLAGHSGAFGVGVGVGDLFFTPVLILLAGLVLTGLVRSARATVQEAAALEAEQALLQQQQLRTILEQRLAASSSLVAGVAHELNTPLGALRSGADSAQRASQKVRELIAVPESERNARKLERALGAMEGAASTVEQAGGRITEVVGRLERFVSLDEAEHQIFDLAAALRDAAVLVPRDAARIELVTRCDEQALVRGDAAKLSQAFATLLKNAVEAIEGQGQVHLVCQSEGSEVRVEVRDTGRGMADEQLSRLFDVDFVAGARVQARFGLAACYATVRSHGGDISVASALGRGTTFVVTLPLADSAPQSEQLELPA